MNENDNATEYGLVHASYSGNGTLRGKSGDEEGCSFRVLQLRDGLVVALSEVRDPAFTGALEYDTADSLIGTTTDGHPISASGLFEIVYLPLRGGKESTVCRAHLCRELHVGDITSDLPPGLSRFAVANLRIVRAMAISHPLAQVRVEPIADCTKRLRQLEFTKGVDVTAELTVESRDLALEVRQEVAQEVCDLLSLAQGGRVQWISRVDLSCSGTTLHWYHALLVTKPFSSMPVVDLCKSTDAAHFLDSALPMFLNRREAWGLNKGLLDAYLDAKAEGDFLQLRGVKLAVALEMLKAAMISAEGVPELVRTTSEFAEIVPLLKPAVCEILRQRSWGSTERAMVYANLQGLNRIPFRNLVRALCSTIGLTLAEEDLRLFVKCRNSLVHRCRFYCETATDEERGDCPPHETKEEEFFWLLHIMDRIFLRVAGYDGPWVDWSNPGSPRLREGPCGA